MDTYLQDAWLRLGRMLERRRGELGYGFRQRAIFVRDCGAGMISVKTISRLEKGERGSYPESTIGAVEAMYQWSPGSVESVLSGGEPSALATAPASDRNPITVTDSPPTAGERLASWMYVRMRERGHDDDVIFDFLDAEGLPREPTSVSSVKRIADATGATVTEILALLGVDDISSQRTQRQAAIRATGRSSKLGDAGQALALQGSLTALPEPPAPGRPRVRDGHADQATQDDGRGRRRQGERLPGADRAGGGQDHGYQGHGHARHRAPSRWPHTGPG